MSVGNGFDPSREWLGIDAVDLADPFRALGLAATEADPAVVTAAAERLLARLRGVDPGPFRLAHESLRKRIEACRAEVLAVVATRPRPTAAGGFVPPPPPGLATTGAGGPPAAAMPAPPPLPRPAVGPMATAPVPVADEGEQAVFQLNRPARRTPDSTGVAPALASLLAVVAVVVAAYVLWPALADFVKRPRQVARETPVLSSPAAAVPPPAAATPDRDSDPAFTPREPPPAQPVDGQPVDAEPIRPRRPPRPRPVARMEPGTAADSDRSEPIPFEPTPPGPPTPVAAPPQPSREQRARAAAGVQKALGEAYAAIRSDEFDTADERVAAAARLAAEDDDLTRRILPWQQFARDARAFIQYREKALDAANAGGDYEVRRADGTMTRISVIESTPEKFVYRSAGRNMWGPRSKIPGPILTAIVREWFAADGRPANSVFLGVHLLTKEKPNLGAVRREWDRARQGGEDVANLEPLLDDPIIRAAAE